MENNHILLRLRFVKGDVELQGQGGAGRRSGRGEDYPV